MLKGMRLNAPSDSLIPNITAFYERKIALWRRMREISSAFIGGPKEGVDYSKLAAEMPKLRGELDFIDQSLFEATPLVFAGRTNSLNCCQLTDIFSHKFKMRCFRLHRSGCSSGRLGVRLGVAE